MEVRCVFVVPVGGRGAVSSAAEGDIVKVNFSVSAVFFVRRLSSHAVQMAFPFAYQVYKHSRYFRTAELRMSVSMRSVFASERLTRGLPLGHLCF